MIELEIAKIKIGSRFRKDLGDIKGLARNIDEIGLLHPIVVNENNELIAGNRRIKAYEHLGRKKIPVTVVSVDDIKKAEISENRERKDFTVMEIKAIYDYLHPKLKAEAKKRQLSTLKQGKKARVSKLDERETGRTDERIAAYVGVGKDTLRKIIVIAHEGTPEEIKEADSKARRINSLYNKVKKRRSSEKADGKITPPLPDGIYNVIYADPPWMYKFSETYSRSIPVHYCDMSLQDICELEVPSADNSILFLWATNPKLEEALQVVKAWGYEYKTNRVWVKDKIGLGYWVRGQHELLLIATKGNVSTPVPMVRRSSVLEAPRTQHSAKPHEVYEMIEFYFPNGKYLELFSRNQREGWMMWGLEANNT